MRGRNWWPMAAMAGLAGVVLALILLLLQATRQRDDALRLQDRSTRIVELTLAADAALARADAALGRYALGLKATDRDRYRREWTGSVAAIDELAALARDDPDQAVRIERLLAARDQQERLFIDAARAAGDGQGASALARYDRAGPSAVRDPLAPQLSIIAASERRLLDERIAEVRATARNVNRLITIASILGAVAALASIGGATIFLRAVTDRRAAREMARELESAIRRRTHELEAAHRDLIAETHERAEAEAKLRQAQKMEAVGQLTGGIAHDFNNMLAVIVGGVELASRRIATAPERARHHLDSAMDAARRATELTRRLLAFARVEPALPESVPPGAVVRTFRDLIDRTIGDRIALQTVIEDGDWQVWLDRHQFENALLNLAVNARDAMDGAGQLTIATRPLVVGPGGDGVLAPGDHVAVAVTDTGHGMAPDVVDRVFEPFFTTKPAGQGTGLGMAQVFGFARGANGDVRIASRQGKGTTVTLILPRHTPARMAPRDGPVLLTGEGDEAGTGDGAGGAARTTAAPMTVLVVEDDPRVLVATAGAVQELGHRVIACGNPADAAGLMARHPDIRLVVTDVLMPRLTGPEMVRLLTARHPELAVLFVTGFTGDAEAALLAGHTLLRKPFTIAALDQAIRQAMALKVAAPA